MSRFEFFRSRTMLWLLLLSAAVYAITGIPYVVWYASAPAYAVFGGALTWTEDQDMYYSFIRQAADGHILFINRLTSLEHQPVFFNLEWLLVGWVMALCGGSTDWAYQIWRATGALAVVFGFWTLAQVVLRNPVQRRVALWMCVFGGALEWLHVALEGLSRAAERLVGSNLGYPSMDFTYIATHPYAQIMANPHFALPLGVFMLVFASYLKGEQTGDWRWYATAGGLAAIEGVMRPYDMIALYTTIPVFVVVELLVTRSLDWRELLRRVLPLLVVAPVFIYTVYLFDVHPIFRYWASQGAWIHVGIGETLAQIGLAGALFAIRLCLIRNFPLKTSSERLLLVWFAIVFCFVHSSNFSILDFMPYSHQLITILVPPIILLGVVVVDPSRWKWTENRPLAPAMVLVGFVAINSLDSVKLVHRLSPPGDKLDGKQYFPVTEMAAYEWLGREASENDVVICLRLTGHRLAKYASVRVVSGHWSVTPYARVNETNTRLLFQGAMSPSDSADLLKEFRVRWIYFGGSERLLAQPDLDWIPGFTKHVINDDVTVYRSNTR